jgi:hypothetical protein
MMMEFLDEDTIREYEPEFFVRNMVFQNEDGPRREYRDVVVNPEKLCDQYDIQKIFFLGDYMTSKVVCCMATSNIILLVFDSHITACKYFNELGDWIV